MIYGVSGIEGQCVDKGDKEVGSENGSHELHTSRHKYNAHTHRYIHITRTLASLTSLVTTSASELS